MKTFFLSLSVVLICCFSFQKHYLVQLNKDQILNSSKLECPAPPSFSQKVISEVNKQPVEKSSSNIDQNWYSKAMENIQKTEYNISYDKELGAYQSPNRKNNIRFIYHKDGFTAVTRDAKEEKGEEWSVELRIRNYELGIKNYELGIKKEVLNVAENKAYIENENFRIDYINNEDGMRQDFIIKQKPEGAGKLRLNLTADTKLKMIVGADALMFKDDKGIDRMKYSALKCWDANHRELRAYFVNNYELRIRNYELEDKSLFKTNSKSEIPNSKLFSIVVNDEDAVYPITIDPLSTSPSWIAESNQSGAQFGFSVGTAGDVNGDGYSDVIVGASYYDNGQTDAGKSYVYFGSATGLSVTPDWTAEGNSDLLNTGYSVSTAGDVNGDGFSDVVVGAKNTDLLWKAQTSGTIENLQDVYFTSPSTGCTVGANGTIETTTDGGTSWTLRNSFTPNDLRSNWFTTPDSGWAVGLAGTIRVTVDGGATWAIQNSGTSANLSCVYFRTSQEGYVVGGNGSVRKTTNAGINWTAQTSGITAELRDIIFTSSSTGFIVGANGRILKTINGGTNWTLQTSGTTQTLRGVYFSSTSNGLAFGHAGTILKTTDGGATWTPQTSGTTQDLYACYFTSPLVGWTVGFGSTVLKTTDGGVNWSSQSSGVSGDLRSIYFSATDSACAVGSGGILYTYNAAATGAGGIANVYNGSVSGLAASPSSILSGGPGINNIVSTAGDINGDGYSDVLVGYPNSSSGFGTVFVFNGSATGSQTTPNTTLTGNQSGSLFGSSISTAGDVDGDGYSDILVGSPEFENGNRSEGKAHLYRGSASGIITPAYWTYESNVTNARLGRSVSTAGDVNGDGYSDIIIGSEGFITVGKVYSFLGSASGISATPDWTYEDILTGGLLGYSVSAAGDINGDGYSDVIVGNPLYGNGETGEGRALVFNGSAAGLSTAPNWTTESNQSSANYGNCVFTAGDINGDGFSDVIVGSNLFDNGESDEGSAFVYNGSPSGLTGVNWSTAGGQDNSVYGFSVSSAGDVNSDGYADVIVGAPYYDNGQTDEGRAFVFHGSAAGLSAVANWSAESDQASSLFGISVSTAGDVNGDGYSDVIIGAHFYSNGQANEGRAYAYYGSASGLSITSNWTAENNNANSNFGNSVSTAGDVNGDGFSDVIIGAYNFSSNGRAYVYYGSASGLSLTSNWNSTISQFAAQFGYSVSTAGDINGDGYSDVIIGAPSYDNGQTNEGRAYVYNGSSTGLSLTQSWTTESNQAGSIFGTCVSSAGDVNGDGYSDVIVGANLYTNGESNEGKTFVYQGSGSGLPALANWTAESNQADSRYGSSVSSAGDVNGDGYSDILVGAFFYDNGESDEGNVFEYNGSASGLSLTSNGNLQSNLNSAQFGMSVSSAGDVNGDGYSDVIIGAPSYNNGAIVDGAAFVYYGNSATGMRSTVQQYKPGSSNVVCSGGLTGTNGQVKLNIFGKSSYGRADGKIIYEYKDNTTPFTGAIITNSTSSSGAGSVTDLGTTLTGVQLNNDVSGLNSSKEYKWRSRVQYSLVNNPFQKFGPWKYYNNYIPSPLGNFRPSDGSTAKQLNLTMLIQGFYNSSTDLMVQDTARVYLRNSTTPYAIVDSAKAYLSSSGAGTFSFSNAANGVSYYLQLKQRNSLETWSKTTQAFTANSLTYNFTTANTQAYGNNMINVDASPVRFADYSGDVNQDGTIDLNDVLSVYNAASGFSSGYVVNDVNGDNIVDLNDILIAYNNSTAFVAVMKP